MREKLWNIVTRNHPEGAMLSRWLIAIRAILYPLDTFYWKMSRSRGYSTMTDVWIIDGIRYSGAGMRALANADGETYKITTRDGLVTIERVDV